MTKHCPICYTEFVPKCHAQKFCSPECARIYEKQQRKRINIVIKRCLICNAEFIATGKALTCSPKCSEMLKEKRRRERGNPAIGDLVPCKICGKLFPIRSPSAIYCSDACRKEANRSKAKERKRENKERQRERQQQEQEQERRPVLGTLAEIAKAATDAGLTYGTYVMRLEMGEI